MNAWVEKATRENHERGILLRLFNPKTTLSQEVPDKLLAGG